jgi:hypothetical protein
LKGLPPAEAGGTFAYGLTRDDSRELREDTARRNDATRVNRRRAAR